MNVLILNTHAYLCTHIYVFSICLPGLRGHFLQSCFLSSSAQHVLLYRILTAQVKDFAFVFAKFCEVPLNLFIQSVEVSELTVSPSTITPGPCFGVMCDSDGHAFHPTVQVVDDVTQHYIRYWALRNAAFNQAPTSF